MTGDGEPRSRLRIIADGVRGHIQDMDRWEVLWYLFMLALGYLLSQNGVTIW